MPLASATRAGARAASSALASAPASARLRPQTLLALGCAVHTAVQRPLVDSAGLLAASKNAARPPVSQPVTSRTAAAGISSSASRPRKPLSKVKLQKPFVDHGVESIDSDGTSFGARADRTPVIKRVYNGDYEGFVQALESQDRAAAWLKFRDTALSTTTRHLITQINVQDLVALLSRHEPPKVAPIQEAIEIMKQLNLAPTYEIFHTLIRSYGKTLDIARAKQVLADMAEHGLAPNIQTYNQFLRIVAQNLSLEDLSVFVDLVVKEGFSPNSETLCIVINKCLAVSRTDLARQYLEHFDRLGVQHDISVINELLRMHVMDNDLDTAVKIFEENKTKFGVVQKILCQTMLHSFVSAKRIAEADELAMWLLQMSTPLPNGGFFQYLRVKAASGEYDSVIKFVESLEAQSPKIDMINYHGIVAGLCDASEIDRALAVIQAIKLRNYRPPIMLFTPVMRFYATNKQYSQAYALFDELLFEGYTIGTPMYKVMLSIAVDDMNLAMLKSLWAMAVARRETPPDAEMYALAIQGHTLGHDIFNAVELANRMRQAGMPVPAEICHSLIIACVRAHKLSLAAQALGWLRESQEGSSLDISENLRKFAPQLQDLIIQLVDSKIAPGGAFDYASGESHVAPTDDVRMDAEDKSDVADVAQLNVPSRSLIETIGGQASEQQRHKMAVGIYRELIGAGIELSEQVLRMIMFVHHKQGSLVEVVKVWTRLQSQYPSPEPESVALLLKTASEHGQLRTAQAIHNLVSKDRLALNYDGFAALLVLLARHNMAEDVIHTMVDMVREGHALSPTLYRQVRSAFEKATPKDRGAKEKFMAFVEEQYPEIIQEDSVLEAAAREIQKSLIPE
ncbi:hypothetical protein HK105_209219 [Polyrhizophydium stewartii]|uniref:Pentatricopeptide repeat protein n=1 Tax=Polyrhizophydium stewartii TaxID=2732419 RepID=A0ABR4MVM7_9FUNG|nr:hypothetical protein HK105_008106 [Polyrhizophydium stewartii]